MQEFSGRFGQFFRCNACGNNEETETEEVSDSEVDGDVTLTFCLPALDEVLWAIQSQRPGCSELALLVRSTQQIRHEHLAWTWRNRLSHCTRLPCQLRSLALRVASVVVVRPFTCSVGAT